MRVVVTGGAGFVGSHVCVALAEAGHEPVIVDTFVNAKRDVPERIGRITGRTPDVHAEDVRDPDGMDRVFSGTDVDAVVHCAALKAVGESVEFPLRYYDTNVAGTITLLKAMARHGVDSIEFSSSATVYGDPVDLPVDETHPASNAVNPYGWTKVMMEQVLIDVAAADPRWSIAILRYFNPVGAHPSGLIGEDPSGTPTNLMPYIARVASGSLDRLQVHGDDYDTPDGTGIRDYIHVVDLAEGHVLALEKLEPGNSLTYNLGTGRGTSVMEMIAAFQTATGVTIPYSVGPRRAGDVAETWATAAKAEAELGWKARLSIEDMCADMWRWQRSDHSG